MQALKAAGIMLWTLFIIAMATLFTYWIMPGGEW